MTFTLLSAMPISINPFGIFGALIRLASLIYCNGIMGHFVQLLLFHSWTHIHILMPYFDLVLCCSSPLPNSIHSKTPRFHHRAGPHTLDCILLHICSGTFLHCIQMMHHIRWSQWFLPRKRIVEMSKIKSIERPRSTRSQVAYVLTKKNNELPNVKINTEQNFSIFQNNVVCSFGPWQYRNDINRERDGDIYTLFLSILSSLGFVHNYLSWIPSAIKHNRLSCYRGKCKFSIVSFPPQSSSALIAWFAQFYKSEWCLVRLEFR